MDTIEPCLMNRLMLDGWWIITRLQPTDFWPVFSFNDNCIFPNQADYLLRAAVAYLGTYLNWIPISVSPRNNYQFRSLNDTFCHHTGLILRLLLYYLWSLQFNFSQLMIISLFKSVSDANQLKFQICLHECIHLRLKELLITHQFFVVWFIEAEA